MPEFYSGATDRLGCFTEGFLLRRLQIAPNVVAYIRYLRERALGGDINAADGNSRERLVAARAALAELDLQERRGEMIAVDLVTKTWTDAYAILRQHLLALPTRIAPLVVTASGPAEVAAILNEQMISFLAELSEIEIEAADDADTPPPDDAHIDEADAA